MSKLTSRKFWIVMWACLLVTVWGSYSLFTGKSQPWMAGAVALLIAIPAGYTTILASKKKKEE